MASVKAIITRAVIAFVFMVTPRYGQVRSERELAPVKMSDRHNWAGINDPRGRLVDPESSRTSSARNAEREGVLV